MEPKKNKANETVETPENVLQELDDAALDEIAGAGDPLAQRPRTKTDPYGDNRDGY